MRLNIALYASILVVAGCLPAAAQTPAASPPAPVAAPAAPKMTIPMPYNSIPGSDGQPGEVMQPSAPATPELSNNVITATLIDGTKVEFDAGGIVLVINKDGSKTPAPDGMLTLRDGTPFVVKDGKRVTAY